MSNTTSTPNTYPISPVVELLEGHPLVVDTWEYKNNHTVCGCSTINNVRIEFEVTPRQGVPGYLCAEVYTDTGDERVDLVHQFQTYFQPGEWAEGVERVLNGSAEGYPSEFTAKGKPGNKSRSAEFKTAREFMDWVGTQPEVTRVHRNSHNEWLAFLEGDMVLVVHPSRPVYPGYTPWAYHVDIYPVFAEWHEDNSIAGGTVLSPRASEGVRDILNRVR